MRTLALLGALVLPAAADPGWESRVSALLPPGLELPPLDLPAPAARPLPEPPPVPADTQSVALRPLFERHLTGTSGYAAGSEHVDVSGTLDLSGDGFLAVTPAGGPTRFFKLQRGMRGSWTAGGRRYSVSLSVSIFRPRLSNSIVITDDAGVTVWSRQIRELFHVTYGAGEPVTLAGRPYRLFYSRQPDGSGRSGLCFIYEDFSTGIREYRFYLIPVEQLMAAAPSSYRLYRGDEVFLHISPDAGTLTISR